ncbi:MAG: flagellar M-ring protein [Gemmatales bacterium]|nr:MAG: flagellar M-ring protein [Gemmatales bacterium]
MEFFQRVIRQFQQFWEGLSLARKVALSVTSLLVVGLLVAVGYWSLRPEYKVLFSGLSPEDAGAITSNLESRNTPFRVTNNGSTILVPAELVGQLRVELAAQGLPGQTGKGFELFDETSLGTTPFTQHVNYVRALQAELARTIMQLKPVQYARVLIARSEPSPFIRERKPTTASVVVRLQPGATLDRSMVAGIVALVSRAVEGLAPENVTVVDADGRVLSAPPTPESGVMQTQLDFQRGLESYLSAKAEEMLSQVLGPGKAIVQVAADINFQKLRERRETFNPEQRAVTSEKITNVKTQNQATPPQGVAGTGSNVPGRSLSSVSALPGFAGSSSSQEETIETDYAVSKVTQEFENRFGKIERLTVAAMVDLSEAENLTLADVQAIIERAVGYKTSRDEIKVSNVKLKKQALLPAEDDEEYQRIQFWQRTVAVLRNVSLGLAALTALILGVMLLRRLRPETPTPPAQPPERERMRERLVAAAQQDPRALAQVLSALVQPPEAGGSPPPGAPPGGGTPPTPAS